MNHTRTARCRFAIALVAVLAAVLAALPAGASAQEEPSLGVMTQNLYLGSSLNPALEAASSEEFIEAVARIYATVQYTNFPARAKAIAKEIEAAGPDVIGLQEVSKWTVAGPPEVNPPPGYDFLAILEGELEALGLNYEVAAIANNAKIGPAPLVVSESSCPVLEGPEFTCSVTLEDRDVILVNGDTPGLSWGNPQSGRYLKQQVAETPVGPLSFDRGWATIDVTYEGRSFRFANTHLETEASPLVQEEQAAEFLAGPGAGGTVIATGDFNSASDGSTTDTYALLTAPGEFNDAWDEEALGAGLTCCQSSNTPPLAPGALNNPESTLATRIDLVLVRGNALTSGEEAAVVGNEPFQAEPPFWPSDHAGVVTEVEITDLAVETSSLPDARVQDSYSATARAAGGTPPYSWSAAGLPEGLSIDPDTGEISGTPARATTQPVNLTVTDSRGAVAESGPFQFHVAGAEGQPVEPPEELEPPDRTPPAFWGLRIAPNRFPSLGRQRGTTITWRLSERARVDLLVQRRLPGRFTRVGGKRRCVRPTRALVRSGARPCVRFRNRGRMSRPGEPGLNRFRYVGWLYRQPLGPGAYRIIAVAVDAANLRSPQRVRAFVVLPPPRRR